MNGQEPVPLSQECIFWRFISLKQGIVRKFSPPDLASRDLESGSLRGGSGRKRSIAASSLALISFSKNLEAQQAAWEQPM